MDVVKKLHSSVILKISGIQ